MKTGQISVANDVGAEGAGRTLAAAVQERIRAEIINGTLAPNQKLKLDELAQRYGIGLTPLREALLRLTAERMVVSEGQRGFWVAPISVSDLADIMQMRQMIESIALRRSIELGGDEWEVAVLTAFHRLARHERGAEQGGYDDEWERRHCLFHTALVSACQSDWLLYLNKLFHDLNARYRRLTLARLQLPHRDHIREHQEIMDAALRRDADAAAALVEAHFSKTAFLLLERGLLDAAVPAKSDATARAFLMKELERARLNTGAAPDWLAEGGAYSSGR